MLAQAKRTASIPFRARLPDGPTAPFSMREPTRTARVAAAVLAGLLGAFTLALSTPADAAVAKSTWGAVQRACNRSPSCELTIDCTGNSSHCTATGAIKGGGRGTFNCDTSSKNGVCIVIYAKRAPTKPTPHPPPSAGTAAAPPRKGRIPVGGIDRVKVSATTNASQPAPPYHSGGSRH